MNGTPVAYVESSAIGPDTQYGIIYNHIVHSFLMMGAPLLILIVFTCLLIYTVHQIGKNKFVSRSHDRASERRITAVMIVVMAVCVICHTPERIYAFVRMSTRLSSTCSPGTQRMFVFAYIINLMVILNSTTNFLIYYIMRQKFRQNLVLMFCKKCASEEYILKAQRQSRRGSKVAQLSIKNGSLRPRGLSTDSATSFSITPLSGISSETLKSNGTPQTAMSSLAFNFNESEKKPSQSSLI